MKDFIIYLVSSIIFFFCVLFFISMDDNIKGIYICNSFFATGIFFFLIGTFTYVGNAGGFDALKYSCKSIVRFSNTQSYYDYKQELASKPKKPISGAFIIGVIYIIISIILMFVLGLY